APWPRASRDRWSGPCPTPRLSPVAWAVSPFDSPRYRLLRMRENIGDGARRAAQGRQLPFVIRVSVAARSQAHSSRDPVGSVDRRRHVGVAGPVSDLMA